MHRSAHVDTFARDRLPPPEQWPEALPMPLPLEAGALLKQLRGLPGGGELALGARDHAAHAAAAA